MGIPEKKLVFGILRDVYEITEVAFWLQTEFFGFLFSHDQAGAGSVSLENNIFSFVVSAWSKILIWFF